MTPAAARSDETRTRYIAFAAALVAVFTGTSLTCYAIGMRGQAMFRDTILIRGIESLQSAVGIIPGVVAMFLLLVAATAAIVMNASFKSFLFRTFESLVAGFLVSVLLGTFENGEGGAVGIVLGQRLANLMSSPIASLLCGVTALLALWLVIEGNLRDFSKIHSLRDRGPGYDREMVEALTRKPAPDAAAEPVATIAAEPVVAFQAAPAPAAADPIPSSTIAGVIGTVKSPPSDAPRVQAAEFTEIPDPEVRLLPRKKPAAPPVERETRVYRSRTILDANPAGAEKSAATEDLFSVVSPFGNERRAPDLSNGLTPLFSSTHGLEMPRAIGNDAKHEGSVNASQDASPVVESAGIQENTHPSVFSNDSNSESATLIVAGNENEFSGTGQLDSPLADSASVISENQYSGIVVDESATPVQDVTVNTTHAGIETYATEQNPFASIELGRENGAGGAVDANAFSVGQPGKSLGVVDESAAGVVDAAGAIETNDGALNGIEDIAGNERDWNGGRVDDGGIDASGSTAGKTSAEENEVTDGAEATINETEFVTSESTVRRLQPKETKNDESEIPEIQVSESQHFQGEGSQGQGRESQSNQGESHQVEGSEAGRQGGKEDHALILKIAEAPEPEPIVWDLPATIQKPAAPVLDAGAAVHSPEIVTNDVPAAGSSTIEMDAVAAPAVERAQVSPKDAAEKMETEAGDVFNEIQKAIESVKKPRGRKPKKAAAEMQQMAELQQGQQAVLFTETPGEPSVATANAAREKASGKIVEITLAAPAVAESSAAAPAESGEIAPVIESLGADSNVDRAARLIIRERRASISFLQRKLEISLGDAQHLMASLEAAGVVGPYRGTPSRDILLSLADWESLAR